MLAGKQILVVSPNQLQGMGLKSILMEVFSAADVMLTNRFDGALSNGSADYIFLPSDMYVAHETACHAVKHRIVILTDFEPVDRLPEAPAMLNVTLGQGDLVDRLKSIIQHIPGRTVARRDDELTAREIEVLKLVARGIINKQIADRLSISLHTVISHRKNITRKLGIKTVSGLTVYALLNGLISPKNIE